MDSLSLVFACGFTGRATGTSSAPSLTATAEDVVRCTASGANWQVYKATLTVAVSGTTTLDLTSALVSILGETISGTLDFATVKGVLIEHDPASLSTTGITVFGGGSNDFQGPFAAGDKPTLLPGEWVAIGKPATGAGWTVDGTHKNIAVVNLDATALHTATVNVFILGKVA